MKIHGNLKIVAIALMAFVVIMNWSFAPGNIISWDVYGYYLYLPATFIYQDLGLVNKQVILDLMDQYNSSGTFYQAHPGADGLHVMKYSMGMAILYLPFFLLGCLGAFLFDFPIDGFSVPFQQALFFGGIVYSLIGLWVLTKVLNHFFSWKVAALVLVLITLGTNYMVHVTMYGQNAMSQNYLFTGYALMLWLTIKWHENQKKKYAILVAFVGGLMTLSRPTEIVVFLIPVLWGIQNKETLLAKWKLLAAHKSHVILMMGIVAVIGSSQLIYWKLFTGKLLYDSYGNNAGEGMELLSPYTGKFLFSFRKGWLVYTPIMIFALGGIVATFKKNKGIFLSIGLFTILNVYLISSWSNWWYAQSFSQRAMVSSYPFLAIGLGYFFNWMLVQKKWTIVSLSGLIGFVFLLNVFQTIQFNAAILNGDRMTKEYYFASFGKLSVPEEYDKLLLVDRSIGEGKEAFKYKEDYTKKVFNQLDFNHSDGSIGFTGCCSEVLDSNQLYTPPIIAPYFDLTKKDHVWLRVSAWVYIKKELLAKDLRIVMHFEHKGYIYDYRVHKINPDGLKLGEWNEIEFYHLTPEVRKTSDKLKTYVWYVGNDQVLVDDLKVEIFEKK